MAIQTNNIQIDGSLNVDGSIFQFGQEFKGGGGGSQDAIIGDGVTKITVSNTAPANPEIGDLWIDTN